MLDTEEKRKLETGPRGRERKKKKINRHTPRMRSPQCRITPGWFCGALIGSAEAGTGIESKR